LVAGWNGKKIKIPFLG